MIGQLAGAAIGIGMGIANNKRQDRENQRNRMHDINMMRANAHINQMNAKDLTLYNRQQQEQLWQNTGYEAQRKQMEAAGLNVGLMYGMGGGGGQTASLATGSGAVGHSSTKGEAYQQNPMDIANSIAMAQQTKTNAAQEELIKAQTVKTEVEAEKIAGVDTEESKARTTEAGARTSNMIQDVLEKKQSQGDRMTQIAENTKQEIAATEKERNEATISTETADAQIRMTKAKAAGAIITNELLKSEVKVNEAQIKEISARIEKMSQDVLQGWEKLSIEQQRNKIQTFSEEIKANYPNIFNVGGKVIDGIIRGLQVITGGGDHMPKHKVE